jgi:hypothetical protein
LLNAQVAKLVDALCSGRSVRKDVLVRIQSWAQRPFMQMEGFCFITGRTVSYSLRENLAEKSFWINKTMTGQTFNFKRWPAAKRRSEFSVNFSNLSKP